MFKKNMHNILFTLAVLTLFYCVYKTIYTVREGKKNKNDCFKTGAGVGCHRFYKSKLPTNGDYNDMIVKCKNDKKCLLCVKAVASLDSTKINGLRVSEDDVGVLNDLMNKPEQKCKLTMNQIATLERSSNI
tara:strand:- start:145 stop:537 length:393 start_codon:yes stop_codon:yes gene_type:complete